MFYTFNQNNSGGSFIRNSERGIDEKVIIEATNADEANNKALQIGIYFNGVDSGADCPCCGDRWWPVGDSDGDSTPSVYGMPIEEDNGYSYSGYIHYLGGAIKPLKY
jgi:hypothetical protein